MFQTQEPETTPKRGLNPKNPQSKGAPRTPSAEQQKPTKIQPLRFDTVFSKFPFHNLSRRGKIQLRLIERTPEGKLETLLKVLPHSEFGEPRELAYRLDKEIINHRIDQTPRPLPRYIRLGTLREIARELSIKEGDTNSIKNALRQNAAAFIIAKFSYTDKHGNVQRLERDFTRYNLVFWNHPLPDGTTTDAVYIQLLDPLHQVLNETTTRPLDREYFRRLKPRNKRLYEIISPKIFAAIKYDNPEAKTRYSEYSGQHPQPRHPARQPAQNQMNKLHLPHIQSGYIAKVRWQKTTDEQGSPDWFIHYTPGPKAFVEYEAFTGKTPKSAQPKAAIAPASPNSESRGVATPPESALDPKRLSALTTRGVLKTEAVKFLSDAPRELLEHIDDSLDYFDTQDPNRMTNPGALLAELIRKKISFPENFVTRAMRRQHETERKAHLKQQQKRQYLETLYNHYKHRTIRQWVDQNIPSDEFSQQLKKTAATLAPIYSRTMTPEQLQDLATSAAYGKFEHRVPLMTFDAFAQDKTAQEKAQASLAAASDTSTTQDPPAPSQQA